MKRFLIAVLTIGPVTSISCASDPPLADRVSELLFEHVLIVEYPDEAMTTMSFSADGSVQFTEINLADLGKSKTLRGSWQWDGDSLCVTVVLGTLCHAIDERLAVGEPHGSSVTYVDTTGQVQATFDVNLMLVP